MAAITRLAPAKVNLFLHVGPLEADGYHPLASLVVFADVGDRLTVEPAERLSLTVTGPFAGALEGEGDNLVLRAVRALGAAAGVFLERILGVAGVLAHWFLLREQDCAWCAALLVT